MGEPTSSDEAMVLLTTCHDDVEAVSVRSLLESEGIEVLVQGQHHRALEGSLFGTFIALRVLVRRRDLEDAREILEELAHAEHLPPDPPEAIATARDRSLDRWRERARDDDDATAPAKPLDPNIARIAGIVFPLGGAHLYARKWGRAALIGGFQLLEWVLLARGWNTWIALLMLVFVDTVGATWAVILHNKRLGTGPAPTPPAARES
jgi:hypothetical protein